MFFTQLYSGIITSKSSAIALSFYKEEFSILFRTSSETNSDVGLNRTASYTPQHCWTHRNVTIDGQTGSYSRHLQGSVVSPVLRHSSYPYWPTCKGKERKILFLTKLPRVVVLFRLCDGMLYVLFICGRLSFVFGHVESE